MDLREESGRRELGRRIQTAIAQAGYSSLPAFAEALGCSRALIYQYVGGDVLVQLDRLTAIAELTGRPLDWFVVEDPNGAAGEVQQLERQADELRQRCEDLEAALARERGGRLSDAEAARRSLLEALQDLCRAQRKCGDMHGLLKSAARCGDLAKSLGDDGALMSALLESGHATFGLGERQSAEDALEAALRLALELGDERVEMSARQELVRVWQASGRFERAREQAEALAEANRWWPRWAGRTALAGIAEQCGALAEAEAHLADAEGVIAEEGAAPHEHVRMARVYVQSNRVNIALARGHYCEAARQAERLQELAAEAGLSDQVREAALDRAIVALRTDRTDLAKDLLARLREWAELSGDRRMAGLTSVFEAERLVRAGEASRARGLALDAIETGNGSVNGQIVAEAELVLGMACLGDGLTGDAAYHLKHCRDRADRLGLKRVGVAARLWQGRVMAAEHAQGACEALREARDLARQVGYADLADEAVRALDSLAEQSRDDT